jgi:two-component system, chemotaxis family, protein-glutamate methylesterase/glutaminase
MLSPPPSTGETEQARDVDAVVVGASAGAIEALNTLLPSLPSTLQTPVIVVVHLPASHPSLLAELFAPKCQLSVREAVDKEPIAPATIWFAPPGYHLLVERDQHFALSIDEPINYSRPSIDVLFESAADAYGERLLALVLTGANQDGAAGAATVRAKGGFVGVQDPATAIAPTMPALALERARPQCVGSVGALGEFVRAHALGRSP